MLSMSDDNWNLLLGRIKAGRCTPFLGAGASSGAFPLGSELARELAKEYGYPYTDSFDLARVAQFVAVTVDPMTPKYRIQGQFQSMPLPDFASPDEPYRVLADLPLPIYMTTNYDNSIISALKSRNKNPKLELCRWNTYLSNNEKSIFDVDPTYTPTPASPLVFHLHGHYKVPESIVLTEDDFLVFLANISSDYNLLPPRIRRAMAGSLFLFLGYRMADWDFRVLFRSFMERSLVRKKHIAVLIEPEHEGFSKEQHEEVQKYLKDYYAQLDVGVSWGSCREFAAELRRRWLEYNHGN